MLVLSVILSALKQLIFDISVFLSTLLFISAFKWIKQSIFFSLLFFLHLNDLNDRYFFFLHLKDQYFCFHAFCFIFLLIFLRLNNSNDVYIFFLYFFLHSIDVCSFYIFSVLGESTTFFLYLYCILNFHMLTIYLFFCISLYIKNLYK